MEAPLRGGSIFEPGCSSSKVSQIGSISVVYTRVGPDADVEAVAADLRNHGAIILVVYCTDYASYKNMNFALVKEGKGHRGDGDREEPGEAEAGKRKRQSRPPPDAYPVQYTAVGHHGFIVAGRRGIDTEVDLKYTSKYTSDDKDHALCIADIQLRSAFCQIMSFRVAGCSLLQTRGDGVEPDKWVNVYEDIGEQLSRFAVRVLAGEFRDHTGAFLQEMRKQACINIAAWLPYMQENDAVCVSSSYMFVLGQVKSLHLAFTDPTPWERKRNSRGNGREALPTWVTVVHQRLWRTCLGQLYLPG